MRQRKQKNQTKRKALAAVCSCALALGSAPASSASQTVMMGDGSVNVPLTAVIESEYSVSLPASVALEAGSGALPAGGIPFTGTATVGVKGNLAPGKAVVVVPTDGAVEDGKLTEESKANGESEIDGITTASLNSMSKPYEASVTIRGTGRPGNTETVKAVSNYVRWTSPDVSDLAKYERQLTKFTYSEGAVSLSTKLYDADTYTGNLQFTFKLVDRD